MFLDSLVNDAAWRARYAQDLSGTPVPFDLLEEEIRAAHPFAVFQLREMRAVSYFEKTLYELLDDQVTKENILKLANDIEAGIQGCKSRETVALSRSLSMHEAHIHETRVGFTP